MTLSVSERNDFFSQAHIAVISISTGEYSAPLSVPIWYYYVPDQEFWLSTGLQSAKYKALQQAKTLSLAVQTAVPLQYVTAETKVISQEKTTQDQAYRIAERYIPDTQAAHNFADSVILSQGDITLHLEPTRWLSALLT